MNDGIYPNWIRDNCLAYAYCELAMDHCYHAITFYESIQKQKFHAQTVSDIHEFQKHTIATIVFSGMCLESFFNDYAAACLEDAEFYENFEKLDIKSKFVLITKFILHTEIDKSKSYYSHLISLIKNRNTYVHNKSYKSKFQGYSKEEYLQIHENMENPYQDIDYDNDFLSETDIKGIKSDLTDCLNAIKAIRDIADFIDHHDPNAYALIRLMDPFGGSQLESKKEKRILVFSKIGIKVT